VVSIIEEDTMVRETKTSTKNTPKTTVTSFIDSLHLEDSAKQLEELKALIFKIPETNHTKIEFIKEELHAGRYEINSNTIAAKLTEYAEALEQPELA